MRHTVRFVLLAGAALALSACNRQAPADNNAVGEVGDTNDLGGVNNDASAMESANEAPPPPPVDAGAANVVVPDTRPDPVETPNVESNVEGM